MSEYVVSRAAEQLNLPLEQTNALWLIFRQNMLQALQEGRGVDLGFGYLSLQNRKARRRHDFALNQTIQTPPQVAIGLMVPPHIRGVLGGTEKLNHSVFMTRSQIKELPAAALAALKAHNLDYYRLKGVTR